MWQQFGALARENFCWRRSRLWERRIRIISGETRSIRSCHFRGGLEARVQYGEDEVRRRCCCWWCCYCFWFLMRATFTQPRSLPASVAKITHTHISFNFALLLQNLQLILRNARYSSRAKGMLHSRGLFTQKCWLITHRSARCLSEREGQTAEWVGLGRFKQAYLSQGRLTIFLSSLKSSLISNCSSTK